MHKINLLMPPRTSIKLVLLSGPRKVLNNNPLIINLQSKYYTDDTKQTGSTL